MEPTAGGWAPKGAMPGRETVLVLTAHPDDETFRCGGILALLARRGARVQVVAATRGEGGSCGEPPLCAREDLGAVREEELRCACRALGIEPPRFLGYRDETLTTVDEGQALGRVLTVMGHLSPEALITWPPDGLSGHPDHVAVSRWATLAYERAAAEGWAAPLALYHLAVPRSVADRLGMAQLYATPDAEIDVTVNVSSVWEHKMAAIRCHRTQAGESPILRAPMERQRLFLGIEHLTRAAARRDDDVVRRLHDQG